MVAIDACTVTEIIYNIFMDVISNCLNAVR